jgi:hypothetical protein
MPVTLSRASLVITKRLRSTHALRTEKGIPVKRITALPILLLCCLAPLCAADVVVTAIDAELDSPLEGVKLQAPGLAAAVTDAEGRATLSLPDDSTRVKVKAVLPGYEVATFSIKGGDRAAEVKLTISGVVEGAELVVEGSKPQQTDAQAGVSAVATRQDIGRTGEIGLVEDVMSTIKLMPGVGYSGGWNAMPSIRGGDPREMTAVLDGAYVLYPYEWGGSFSIFDPNMVESAKLSNGIISARYGRVMSGLLEVNTKSPSMIRTQFDFSLSTTGLDVFLQQALAEDLGILAGGKVTWIEVPMAIMGQLDSFKQVPYIRNGYAKAFWRPSDSVELDLNTFVGTDGVGADVESETTDGSLTTSSEFSWSALNLIASAQLKLSLDDYNLLQLLASYNRLDSGVSLKSKVNGTREYDDDFIAAAAPGAAGFTFRDFEIMDLSEDSLARTYQGGLNWDHQFGKGQIVTFGAEGVLQSFTEKLEGKSWIDSTVAGYPQFVEQRIDIETEGNKQLDSGAYALYDFSFLSGALTGEAGLRVDHVYLYNEDMRLNTRPTIDPRLRLEITPWKNLGKIDSLGFTLGSGLYSQLPMLANLFDADADLEDYSIGPSRSWFNVVGVNLKGSDGWNASLEGYYKRYFDRLYIVMDESTDPVSMDARNDGKGYAWGFDLLLQKRMGRYWDGWLSYSFIVARFCNPAEPDYEGQISATGDPLGIWYYPSYHRFHNLNLVLNWKPTTSFTFTLIGQLATGALSPKYGDPISYPSIYTDPATGESQVIERYTRTSEYDDGNRNPISCPISVKLTWSGYYPRSKFRWEYYVGVEDILASVYSPKTEGSIDPFTGKEEQGSDNADYSVGVPIPSVGFKISY